MAASWRVESAGNGTPRFVVAGDFDLADEEPFVAVVAARFRDGSAHAAELDFAAVDFIDSSGLRALMRLHVDFADGVRLVASSPAVHRVLALAGVVEILSDATGSGS